MKLLQTFPKLPVRGIARWCKDAVVAFSHTFTSFLAFFFYYLKKKTTSVFLFFEKYKNVLVRFFMMKRGRYNRPFLHVAAMGVLILGVLVAPFLAETYPVFSQTGQLATKVTFAQEQESITVDSDVFQTKISEKPRDQVITYTVQKGDTISTIAKKYGISTDTIKWANDLKGDSLAIGDELKILPVTGMVHKVESGETVYTIAKKYDTNPQGIVDFPFNDFANPQTFSLVVGQMLVVPDGIKPAEKPVLPRQRYLATGVQQLTISGITWPVRGIVSQYFAWYHTGLDITSAVGTPIAAAQSGTVSEVYTSGWNGGYGVHVIIQGNDGQSTLYAHMSGVNVSVGDSVSAGNSTIGWVGMTGRTTGPHVHFEVRGANGFINPLAALGQ